MLKVLHLTYDMRIGGTEMVIRNIVDGIHSDAAEMSIYCIEAPLGPWGRELKDRGLKVFTYERLPGFDLKLVLALRKHVIEEEINVIHCHQYTPWVYGALASAMLNTKVIFTEHGRFYPDSSSWKRKLINPILNALTNDITAIARATKQALVEFEFLKEKQIKVIYNGIKQVEVDQSKFSPLRSSLNIPANNFVIGTIARLDPIKNQTMLLRSFALVLEEIKSVTLLIVGDGEERARLHTLTQELGITEHVIFTGYIPKPYEYMALMDIFLLPSFSEGTSMTLLESLSMGIPCVVTDVGGNPEIIAHNVTGLVTPSDEDETFANAIVGLLSNKALRVQFSENAKKDFEARFTQQIMQTQYLALYRHLTENSK